MISELKSIGVRRPAGARFTSLFNSAEISWCVQACKRLLGRSVMRESLEEKPLRLANVYITLELNGC